MLYRGFEIEWRDAQNGIDLLVESSPRFSVLAEVDGSTLARFHSAFDASADADARNQRAESLGIRARYMAIAERP